MLAGAAHGLAGVAESVANGLEKAAAAAANAFYAPYSKAWGGAAIEVTAGRIFAGPYLENVAFNPSLEPLQAAYVSTVLGGFGPTEIVAAAIAQSADAKVDHIAPAASCLRWWHRRRGSAG